MKKLVGLLMVTLAGLAIGAVFLWQELRDVRVQSATVSTHIKELQAAELSAAAAAAAAPVQIPTVQTATEPAKPVEAAVPTSTPPVASTEKRPENPLRGMVQQLMGTPEARDMMRAQLRARLPQQYPDLGKELGLSPADTDKLFDLLAKQQMDAATNMLDALGGDRQNPANAQDRQRLTQETQRANQAELAAMLGDKLPKYEEYQKTLPMRRQVNQFQASLGTGSNALTETQSKQLITALAAEQDQIQQDRRSAPRQTQQRQADPQAAIEQQIDRAAEENKRMVNAASSHLNPQQLESYRQMLDQQQSVQRTLLRGIGSQLGNQGAGNGIPGAPTGR